MEELRLTTAAELHAALHSPNRDVQMATLTAIINAPATAQAFGAGDGWGLADELVTLLTHDRSSLVRSAAAAALFSLDDHCSLEQACRLFAEEHDLEIILMAAQRIARAADQMVLAYFLPFLRQQGDAQRQQTAARMLAGRAGLETPDLMRVALLAGETGAGPPPLSPSTLPVWLEALAGEFHDPARGFLAAGGDASFVLLKENWQQLDPGTKAWLLSWGAAAFPELSVELVQTALAEDDQELQRTALAAVACHELFRQAVSAELEHLSVINRDKDWTIAAIRAGVPVANLRERVFSEQDAEVRIALAERLGREQKPFVELIRLMQDGDWRIRATATDALARLGDAAVDAVVPLLSHERLAVRTAAAQVLARLDKSDLLQVQ